jgi:hypothetical protein
VTGGRSDTPIVSEITSSAVSSVIATTVVAAPASTSLSSKVEEITPTSSYSASIPSVMTSPSMVTSAKQPVTAEAPKMKYKITVMPEALCDGCQ